MTLTFVVLSVFTTFASGKARWICSATESVLHTVSVGGMPLEKSSGFEMSIRILPRRFCSPASRSASSETVPDVALITISPCAAASANVPTRALLPVAVSQSSSDWPKPRLSFSLPGERVPSTTSSPRSTSLAPMVCPTTPEPMMPIFIVPDLSQSGRELGAARPPRPARCWGFGNAKRGWYSPSVSSIVSRRSWPTRSTAAPSSAAETPRRAKRSLTRGPKSRGAHSNCRDLRQRRLVVDRIRSVEREERQHQMVGRPR